MSSNVDHFCAELHVCLGGTVTDVPLRVSSKVPGPLLPFVSHLWPYAKACIVALLTKLAPVGLAARLSGMNLSTCAAPGATASPRTPCRGSPPNNNCALATPLNRLPAMVGLDPVVLQPQEVSSIDHFVYGMPLDLGSPTPKASLRPSVCPLLPIARPLRFLSPMQPLTPGSCVYWGLGLLDPLPPPCPVQSVGTASRGSVATGITFTPSGTASLPLVAHPSLAHPCRPSPPTRTLGT